MDRAVLLNDITKIASVGLKLLEDLPWNWLTARFFFDHIFFASKRILTPNVTFQHLYCFFQHSSRISFEVSPQLCWRASMCAALSHQAWMRIAVKQHIIEGAGSCIWSSLKIFLVPFAWISIWRFQWFIHKCHCLILSTLLHTHIRTQAKSVLAWDVTAEWTDFDIAKAYALFQGLRSAESAQHSWQFEFQTCFFWWTLRFLGSAGGARKTFTRNCSHSWQSGLWLRLLFTDMGVFSREFSRPIMFKIAYYDLGNNSLKHLVFHRWNLEWFRIFEKSIRPWMFAHPSKCLGSAMKDPCLRHCAAQKTPGEDIGGYVSQ